MERTPRPSLARRLPSALVLGFATALLGGGAIGFATAAGEDAIAFSLPKPMGGDEAQYAMVGGGEEPRRIDVSAPAPLLLADGTFASAARLRTSQNQTLGDTGMAFVSWRDAYLDVRTGEIVASGQTTTAYRASAGTAGPGPLDSSVQIMHLSSRFVHAPGPAPCGALNGLQGAASVIDGRVWIAGCFPDEDRRLFDVDGIEGLDGVPSLKLSSGPIVLWYQGGIPYPVQMHIELETPGPGNVGLWRLTGFQPGTIPLMPRAIPAPKMLPAIELAPRGPFGPDASGMALPFTLEEAYEQARDDLVAFLDAHPDARIAKADYSEPIWSDESGETNVDHQWTFILRDATAEVSVQVRQPRPPAGPTDLEALVAGRGDDEGEVSVWNERVPEEQTAECWPEQMPTVASVARRWQAVNGDGRGAKGYGFSMGCEQDVSALPGVDAGDVLSYSLSYNGGLGLRYVAPPDEVREHKTGLVVLADGTPSHQWAADITTRTDGWTDVPTTLGSESKTDAFAPRPVSSPAWDLPAAPIAASITLVSILAGALYWLWPAVKTGPFGLFSRLQTPDLLNHPVRKELAQRIDAQPGVHYQDLVRAMGKGKGAIEHHLRKLQEGGLVKSVSAAGYTCFFPAAFDRRLTAAAPALKSEGARKVLAAIQASPGASATEVGVATGLSPAAVNHHLQRLGAAGLVDVLRNGRSLSLQATALASQVAAAGAA